MTDINKKHYEQEIDELISATKFESNVNKLQQLSNQFFIRRLGIAAIRLLFECIIVFFVVKSYPDLSWLWYVVFGAETTGLIILAVFWILFKRKQEKLSTNSEKLFELVNEKIEDLAEQELSVEWSQYDKELDESSRKQQLETAKLSDSNIREMMIGRWSTTIETSDVKTEGWNEFNENGTFESKMKIITDHLPAYCHIRGRWYLSDKVIHWEVKDSTNTELLPTGLEMEDEILVISENQLIYRDGDGNLVHEQRI